jgi:hypothetical protein
MTYTTVTAYGQSEGEKPQLPFGYNRAFKLVPEPLAAWGQRAIITDGGELLDMVPDRRAITFREPKHRKALESLLNDGILDSVSKRFAEMVRLGTIRWDEAREVTLYDDNEVLVVGNANESFGYFYITAMLCEKSYSPKPHCPYHNLQLDAEGHCERCDTDFGHEADFDEPEREWLGWVLLRAGGGVHSQGTTLHAKREDGKTMCGRRIPSEGEILQWLHDPALDHCESCRKAVLKTARGKQP